MPLLEYIFLYVDTHLLTGLRARAVGLCASERDDASDVLTHSGADIAPCLWLKPQGYGQESKKIHEKRML